SSFLLADNSEDDFPSLLPGAGPMHLGSARFKLPDEFDQAFIEMVNGFPLGFCRSLARRFPVLESGPGLVASGFVFAESGLDQLPMPEILGNARALLVDFRDRDFHERASTSAS